MSRHGTDPMRGAPIAVECHEGYRAQETPRRFTIADRTVEVEEVLDRWAGVDHRYFKVRGDDGQRYLLRYDDGEDFWSLVAAMGPGR